MLTIVLQIARPAGQAIGVKEDLAMYCEKFGDVQQMASRGRTGTALKTKNPGEKSNVPATPQRVLVLVRH